MQPLVSRAPTALLAAWLCALATPAQSAQAPTSNPAKGRTATSLEWQALGELPGAGPDVYSLLETPADPAALFGACTAGVAVSLDRGLSWDVRRVPAEAWSAFPSVAVSPLDPDVLLYVGWDTGTWRSDDGGLTWSEPPLPPAIAAATAMQFAPSNAAVVYVATWDSLWRSLDAGLTFDEILPGIDALGGYAADLVVDPANEKHVIVHAPGVGLLSTQDGGSTWTVRNHPAGLVHGFDFDVDPSDMDRILIGDDAGMYVSTDGGLSWSGPGAGVNGHFIDAVSFDPHDPARLYACARHSGPAWSNDGGATWSLMSAPGLETGGGLPHLVKKSTYDPDLLYVTDWGGVFRSKDDGASFGRSNAGLEPFAGVTDVEVDPFDPGHLVAITGGSAYSSPNGGQSWTESTGVSRFASYALCVAPTMPGRFYVGSVAGELWRSDDGGASFFAASSDPGRFFARVATHPTVPDRLLATGADFLRSDDGGVTFAPAGAPTGWCWAAAISAVDPDVQYVAGDAPIYRSEDGGATWIAAASSPPGIVRDLVTDPHDADRAWAAAPWSGLYRTDDRGQTWTAMTPELVHAETLIVVDDLGAPARALFGALSGPSVVVSDAFRARVWASSDPAAGAYELGSGLGTGLLGLTASKAGLVAGTWGSGARVLR